MQAFENFRYSLSHAPVLALPNDDMSFEVVANASGSGCVLCCCKIRSQWLSTATSSALLRETMAVVSKNCWL